MNTPKTILLADDDPDDLEFLETALSGAHHPIRLFHNGKMLTDYLWQNQTLEQTGLVVLDINMPLKDGFAVLSEIRERAKDLPVAVLTASASQTDEARCYELGCDVYLRKPNSMAEYSDIVQRIVKLLEKNQND